MARFDFIESSAHGFKFVWEHNVTLLRLALIPVVLKVAAFAITHIAGWDDNFLRQGLILIPAYAAEGWLIAYVVRWAILGETDVPGLSGDPRTDEALIEDRARLLTGGMLVYLLLKLVMSAAVGLVLTADLAVPEDMQARQSGLIFFMASLVLLGAGIWAFRLIWIYVPVVLGIKIQTYLYALRGFASSFYMIGTWLLCFIPLAFAFMLILQLFQSMAGVEDLDAASLGLTILIGTVQAAADTLIALISSVAMAVGISALFKGSQAGE